MGVSLQRLVRDERKLDPEACAKRHESSKLDRSCEAALTYRGQDFASESHQSP